MKRKNLYIAIFLALSVLNTYCAYDENITKREVEKVNKLITLGDFEALKDDNLDPIALSIIYESCFYSIINVVDDLYMQSVSMHNFFTIPDHKEIDDDTDHARKEEIFSYIEELIKKIKNIINIMEYISLNRNYVFQDLGITQVIQNRISLAIFKSYYAYCIINEHSKLGVRRSCNLLELIKHSFNPNFEFTNHNNEKILLFNLCIYNINKYGLYYSYLPIIKAILQNSNFKFIINRENIVSKAVCVLCHSKHYSMIIELIEILLKNPVFDPNSMHVIIKSYPMPLLCNVLSRDNDQDKSPVTLNIIKLIVHHPKYLYTNTNTNNVIAYALGIALLEENFIIAQYLIKCLKNPYAKISYLGTDPIELLELSESYGLHTEEITNKIRDLIVSFEKLKHYK